MISKRYRVDGYRCKNKSQLAWAMNHYETFRKANIYIISGLN